MTHVSMFLTVQLTDSTWIRCEYVFDCATDDVTLRDQNRLWCHKNKATDFDKTAAVRLQIDSDSKSLLHLLSLVRFLQNSLTTAKSVITFRNKQTNKQTLT